MMVCAQSSQRATCPPRAAVRQLSIALITFNWSRLTWPRLSSRQACPWSRKISATSSSGLPTAVGGLRRRRLLLLQGQMLERACDLSQQVGGDLGIFGGGFQLGVP